MTEHDIPPPDAALILLLADLARDRERNGVAACRERVGGLRQCLGAEPPANVIPIRPLPETIEKAHRQSRALLAKLCRACGKCDWAER